MFSDTLLLGYPIAEGLGAGEPELGRVLSQVAYYQLAMISDGFLLRGGLTVGELHMSRDMVFGKALVEAHILEQEGSFPRIELSKPTVELVRHHMTFYGRPFHAPQNEDLLVDPDGTVFVDYLQAANWAGYSDVPVLSKHRMFVAERLQQFARDEHILQKYRWVRDYHNFFCRNRLKGTEEFCPSRSDIEGLLIPSSDEPRTFRRLADAADPPTPIAKRRF